MLTAPSISYEVPLAPRSEMEFCICKTFFFLQNELFNLNKDFSLGTVEELISIIPLQGGGGGDEKSVS